MRAMCAKGEEWKVFGECDTCGDRLQRRYRAIPGQGAYAEKGMFCAEHGLMVPEYVVYRQNRKAMEWT